MKIFELFEVNLGGWTVLLQMHYLETEPLGPGYMRLSVQSRMAEKEMKVSSRKMLVAVGLAHEERWAEARALS